MFIGTHFGGAEFDRFGIEECPRISKNVQEYPNGGIAPAKSSVRTVIIRVKYCGQFQMSIIHRPKCSEMASFPWLKLSAMPRMEMLFLH